MTALEIRKSIEVDAPAATLWKILTDNQFIKQYMFGCYADTDWEVGSPLLWKGAVDGKLYVKGKIVAIDAPRCLAYTIIDPNSAIADIPENYLTMTYTLTERGRDKSTLEIIQGDFSKVADGEIRYKDTLAGGDMILPAIKKLAEEQSRKSERE